jgi:hypothetical protein
VLRKEAPSPTLLQRRRELDSERYEIDNLKNKT